MPSETLLLARPSNHLNDSKEKNLMMKRFIVGALVLTFAMIAGAQETPEVVATINGEVLTKKAFDQMWNSLPSDMQKSYMASGGKIQFLDNYIRKRLLIQEALKEDFQEREDVKFLVNQAMESALFDAYVRQVVSREVVPESEVRKIYEERESEFILPKRVKARHIVATPDGMAVDNRADSNAKSRPEAHEKMIGIRRQLEGNPGSFADMAMQFSEDASAASGGDLGWFSAGKMVPEFDDIVFDMQPGEMSPVFESRFGYHIVLVEEVKPAGLMPYEEAREKIREELLRQRTEAVLAKVQSLSQELRASSNISINRSNL